MLGFFRRFSKSPLGLAVFALIIVAFIVTLYEGQSGVGLPGVGGGGVASVGGKPIDEAELTRRVQNQLDAQRQQNRRLDMAAFIAAGGVERTVDLTATGRALEIFAEREGMVASKKLIDGAIASIPAFNGPTGKFDQTTFEQVLGARKLSEAMVRADFAREALTKMIAIPASGGARVPARLVSPYASLLLEARQGQIGVVPSAAFAPKSLPTDVEVQTFFQRNVARYTIPERRVIRFAKFDQSRVAAQAAATEAEIAAVHKADPAYAASEKRAFTQVIVPTQAEAAALLAKVRGGTAMAEAARAAKREALTVPATDRAAFERLTSARVTAAAFAAPKDGFAAIERSGLGFHVVRVDAIQTVAAVPLASVRAKIAAEVTAQKQARAIADFTGKIEDDIGASMTFDEVAKKYALTSAATPPLTAGGIAVDTPGYAPPPEVGAVLTDAFRALPEDDPAVVTLPQGAGYALWKLERIVPAAPWPLGEIRAQVVADLQLDKGSKAAKIAADKIVAAVNGGTPLGQALQSVGVPLPAPQPAGGRRLDMAQSQQQIPPPLQMMFAMAEKRARTLQVDGKQGWFVVYLDKIVRGDARMAPGLVEATQQQLSGAIGDEYVQQFAAAIRADVGVKKDAAAIARLKRTLTGQGQ